MKKAVLKLWISASVLMGGAVYAQTPQDAIDYIDGILGSVEGTLDKICSAGSKSFLGITIDDIISAVGGPDLETLLYICEYRSILRQAQRSTSDIVAAIDTSGRTLGDNILKYLTGSAGVDPHADAAAERRITELHEQLRDRDSPVTLADYHQAIQEEISAAETRALNYVDNLIANRESFPEGSEMRIVADRLATNIQYATDTRSRIQRNAEIARRAAETDYNLEAGNLALEEFITSANHQETIVRTLEPEEGTAAKLEERASRATSTREAVNELSRGWADYMRQDAVISGTIVEGLKSIATQQSITNWQLTQEADRLYAKEYAQIEAERAAQEAELHMIAEEFNNTIDGFVSIFQEYNNLFLPADNKESP